MQIRKGLIHWLLCTGTLCRAGQCVPQRLGGGHGTPAAAVRLEGQKLLR